MAGKMKIGVIGLGDIAEVAYLDNLNNPGRGHKVTYVCDLKRFWRTLLS